jgi:hypothetical protein
VLHDVERRRFGADSAIREWQPLPSRIVNELMPAGYSLASRFSSSVSLESRPMRRPRLLAIAVLGVVATACGEAVTGLATRPDAPRRADNVALADVHLLECPVAVDGAPVETEIGVSGGNLANGRQQLRVPGGAVDRPTRLAMRTPASTLMEVELRAVGYERFEFRKPVTVTIDFSRCAAEATPDLSRLRVVHVDDATKRPLEIMGGVVDAVARTITFETGHFSSYVVAD